MRMRKIQTDTGNIRIDDIGTGTSEITNNGIGIGIAAISKTSGSNSAKAALAAGYFGSITPAPAHLVDSHKRNIILHKAAIAFQTNFGSPPLKDEKA
jgi:NADH/NAD ratio-sensing transcriptional regulator Rex